FAVFHLPVVYDPGRNSLEEFVNFPIEVGTLIAGRYKIVEHLGAGVFSRAVQCEEIESGRQVCIKVIRNNKDFLDQSLGEIKLLQHLNSLDPHDEHHVLRMLDYFYYREHLFIVCELMRDNLYEIYKFVANSGWVPYFNVTRTLAVARQCLEALSYIHSLQLIHCDLKPENILIKSLSRCVVKVIDFGSSCFVRDPHSSYVQSRSYRAPEVVLGLPYSAKV
ncbi:kinase-like domain-containing protein, partial [Pavlovales sp. CCMP2436]